jgi:DNA-binding transcriptional regulator GbsR (MarR family)
MKKFIVTVTKLTHKMKQTNTKTAEQQLREIEIKLVNIVASISSLKGRSEKNARTIAYIYIHKKVTQKMLREITGYSLGTISNTLKTLEKMGTITKTQDPKTREYSYELKGILPQSSASTQSTFEYFAQLEDALKKAKHKLNQPQLSSKRGFENINEFVDKMSNVFPVMEQTIKKTWTTFSDKSGGATDQ